MSNQTNAKLGGIIIFIVIAASINVAIGFFVQTLKLPIFLDSIATIFATIVFGWRVGAIVGVLGFFATSITVIFPPAIFFSGTQIAIALFTDFVGKRGGFKNLYTTILSGLGLAIIAALVSAPVIYYLFGGITGNGISIFTIYLQTIGFPKVEAVIISGITAEIFDKTAQCLIVFFVIKGIPTSILTNYNAGSLKNGKF